jgi:5'-nucleotidase/UDP-sugar diphosphatase
MAPINIDRLKRVFFPHGLIYTILGIIIICLFTLTIVYSSLWRNNKSPPETYAVENGIIGYPIRLPNDGRYIQWNFLQMNDVYELLPLDRGRKGGLARVAYIRKLLKEENSHTYTILSGDLLSPSALSLSRINDTTLNGKQMIATMNTLGLDYMTFGNHEFDLTENDLLNRMNESTFTWISTNVFRKDNNQLFGTSISHQILTIDTIRILLIGLTLDGSSTYVQMINQTSLVNYVQEFLKTFSNGTYDLLVAITHLDMLIDIELASKIPQIDLIIGGHEHENYYYVRGTKYTPIYKADANAFTVYIHRFVFNLNTKRLRIFSTLTRVTSEVPEEEKTAAVANYWFNLGIQGFEALGYQPSVVVSCLPTGIELDGRSESVRSSITLLTALISESMLELTASKGTIIGIINGGTVRVDDILRETITQYDILRTLPFGNIVVALSVPGPLLAQVLTTGISLKGNGMFLAYTRVETFDGGKTWLFNGTDISKSGLLYNVATTAYIRDYTQFNNSNVITLYDTNITQTKSLMDYLPIKYPPC